MRPRTRRVAWRRAFRIVPGRYPPVALFERVADPADWEALADVESLTNERLRDEVGEIRLVPPAERVSGPGASWVMAAFTHVGRPSRFSDGRYGVYYAARTRECAIAETVFHWGRFYAATREPACDVDMRVLVSGIRGTLYDLRGAGRRLRAVYDPNDYAPGQALGRSLRVRGSHGIVYDSVRLARNACVAAFRPRVVSPLPRGDAHLMYHWNGERIDRYFDYAASAWRTPPSV